ncbi:MAG: hypothetical protein IT303_14065, partial [Dehalococcoidia bacterium]|nr:hypothetical protein [Dehalococcoidia bacterium]
GYAPGATGKLHVFFELGDHLGSTSVVLDQATGELVERATYQAYGSAESDYRPERWRGFREDYGFTGKEEDVEVGLRYFGFRYLSTPLGRWASPDPLGLHSPLDRRADPNLFAYVDGRALYAMDAEGLWGSAGSDELPATILYKVLDAVPVVRGVSRAVVGLISGRGLSVIVSGHVERVHEMAVGRALGRRVSARDLRILKRRQAVQDHGQSPRMQAAHAMRAKGERKSDAIWRANQFVYYQLMLAHGFLEESRRAAAEGDSARARKSRDAAMVKLGNAIHTMQDATSPVHEGFQEWDSDAGHGKQLHHAFGENTYPTGRRRRWLEGATEWAWDMARSGKIAREVFDRNSGFLALPEGYTEESRATGAAATSNRRR